MDQDAQDVGDCTEILTGFEALRFLCSMSKKQGCITKSNVFSKLYSETQTRETSPLTRLSPSSMHCSPRKQRKAYKPSRVLPVEETLCSHAKFALTGDPLSLSNCPITSDDSSLSKKKSGIVGKGPLIMSDRPDKDSLMTKTMKGKRNKRQNTQCGATIVCKNLACKAVLQGEAPFCRRCSCCICKQFDDNKDPSLWITCDAEEQGGCGLSCHVECALQDRVAGVVRKNGAVSLDGSFLCRSCGKVRSLMSLWKKQLVIAKNARRVDVFCQRLLLSQRLLKGTLKYEDIHSFIDSAIEKLNVEVGLMTKCSAKLERCIVNRLSCNLEVQNMIDLALEKTESLCKEHSDVDNAKSAEICKKPVCTIQFEDACWSSIVVVAVGNHPRDKMLGYKLWHREATDPSYPAAPTYTIQSTSKKVLVSNLKPNTLYAFKIAPFSVEHDASGEACEAECRTEAMYITAVEDHVDDGITDSIHETNKFETSNVQSLQQPSSTVFECIQKESMEKCDMVIKDLNNVNLPSMPELHKGKHNDSVEVLGNVIAAVGEEKKGSCESPELPGVTATHEVPENQKEEDLNNVNLPSMPEVQEGKDDDSVEVLGNVIAVVNKDPRSLKQGACESPELPGMTDTYEEPINQTEEVSVLKNAFEQSPTTAADIEIVDDRNPALPFETKEILCNGTEGGKLAVAGSGKDARPSERSQLDLHNFEFTIRVIRWLESQGHLNKDFRKKFLTWYSLRATEHEKRVVSVYIDTLQDSASSLADQLVDTFQDVVDTKRQRITEIGVYRRRYK